ncbi:hypothetical protein Fcan01_10849 [Folsomia candida]|uniref:Chitin-binding type-4 domain-containing protein n=1 Tax=Folsomia candida TaxID=158441 RepID=A0A226EBX4_FOLCA|nr:hypothetical protein Fcan01_10849 [Folsomia candida]
MGISRALLLVTLYLLQLQHGQVSGHGRMMDPPNRSSLWRLAEYESYNPPINYDDNQLFCGGFVLQYQHNGGKCGECGDPYNSTRPRDNEHGGLYGQGIITKTYRKGQEITISVEITATHMGYFEFRICNMDRNHGPENEACLNQNLLELSNGIPNIPTRYPIPTNGLGWHHVKARLPSNSWGECEDGSYAVGCGNQETFRGCSDIAISN